MPNLKQHIETLASKKRVKIGIGMLKSTPAILDSFKRASKYVDIVTVGEKIEGYENIPADQGTIETKESEIILSGKVDGFIRGQADAYRFEDVLAKMAGWNRSKMYLYMLVEDHYGRAFYTTSGSHSDGWRKSHKQGMVDAVLEEMKTFDWKPKIGFLTWVRPGSVGRNFFFDQTWDAAEELVQHYQKQGHETKNYNIEIETALNEGVNLIVFANGTSGNMFGRVLTFLVKDTFIVHAHAGIPHNIIQNNRTLQDYYDLFVYAAARANGKK